MHSVQEQQAEFPGSLHEALQMHCTVHMHSVQLQHKDFSAAAPLH
jgi:hypothetical protein